MDAMQNSSLSRRENNKLKRNEKNLVSLCSANWINVFSTMRVNPDQLTGHDHDHCFTIDLLLSRNELTHD